MTRPPIEQILTAHKDNYDGPWDIGLIAKLHTKKLCDYALLLENALMLSCENSQICPPVSCPDKNALCYIPQVRCWVNYYIKRAGESNGKDNRPDQG